MLTLPHVHPDPLADRPRPRHRRKPRSAWQVLFQARAGSRKGSGPCDDDVDGTTVQVPAGEVLLGVCADGAGSARFGRRGAMVACCAAMTALQQAVRRRRRQPEALTSTGFLGDAEIHAVFAAARVAVEQAARELQVPPRELATTLLVAAVAPGVAVFGQVGDGVMVAGDGAGGYEAVLWPDQGEYANATHFLTDRELVLRTARRGRVHELAMTTDGLQALALDYAARAAFAPFFRGFFGEMARVAEPRRDLAAPLWQFLGSPAVHARTDDDVTLLLARRRPEADAPAR